MIRLATEEDIDFLVQHDRHLTRSAMLDKIHKNEVCIIEDESEPIGWAGYNLCCDLVPFLTNINVLENHRRRGFGSQLIRHWEEQMKDRGFTFVLTSTRNDRNRGINSHPTFYETGILSQGQALARARGTA